MTKKYFVALIIILNLMIVSSAFADETETFSAQKPDVLIVLDGSGSMLYTPSNSDCKNEGGTGYSCGNKVYGNANCDNSTFGSYSSTNSERNTDCRKIAIARRALTKILNDQEAKQRVRIGFMGFTGCYADSEETGGNATNPRSGWGGAYNTNSGCNRIRIQISDTYTDATNNIFETIKNYVNNDFDVDGGTPLVGSLVEAKKYFQNYSDDAKRCRTKFVILISDGDDTFACPKVGSNYGNEKQKDQYKRRRESVAAVKSLYDAYAAETNQELKEQKIKTFVIGFGAGMPNWSEYTLNWMAYYGQTSFSQTHTPNPLIDKYILDTTKPNDLYPYSSNNTKITACQDSTTDPKNWNPCDWDHTGCLTYDKKIDPGKNELGGYAFMAANAAQLDKALASAFKVIESTYAFATSSVQSVRTKDENYIYEASFSVRNNDPLYIGHLKQYKINDDGTIPTNFVWDAGAKLVTNNTRNIWTYKGGYKAFNTTNINYTDLGVADATEAGKVITFITGGDVATPADDFNGWKLGDTFHSFPVTVGSPATYFCDKVDPTGTCCNNASCKDPSTCTPPGSCCTCEKAFDIFRGKHQRTTALQNRMIVTGANDGQLHMFNTYDGAEKWSFIPPNLLSQLKRISHQSHPETTLAHTYFVDGPISISDAWLPAGDSTIKIAKTDTDWYTWMVFSEGRGAKQTLWSSSSSCDSGLSPYYSATYQYYCGYYAFDLTDVGTNSTPTGPQWILGGPLGSSGSAISSSNGPYLGEPWSKMVLSRVRKDGNEKWVGFFGGGYSNCTSSDDTSCTTRGKGFFVADLKTGSIIKRFSHASNLNMDYQLPAAPAAVDTDNDAFVDHIYIGDLGNNIWRFKLCMEGDDSMSTKCGTGTTGRWVSTALLSSSNHNRKIYTQASVTRDNSGNMWVYVGTGDKMNPTLKGLTYDDRLYAIIDNDLTSTRNLSNLKNITSTTFNPSSDTYNATNNPTGYHGWYIDLQIGDGEKILSEPVVFQGIVYFTTYVPPSGADVCNASGSAYLYAIDYVTGAGKYGSGARYSFIGYGIPSSPLVSMNPYGGTDVYVSTSQKTTQTADTFVKKQNTPTMQNLNKTNLMMWRDKRVQ